MNKYKVFQTRNPSYQRGRALTPVGVLVHSTGANNPNLARYVDAPDLLGVNQYGNHWNKETATKSMHGFIGKDKYGRISYIQTLPYNIACWGAGGGPKGSYNYNPHGYLQFEICEDNLKNVGYYKEAFQAAEDICVELCQMFGWTEKNITSHYEAHDAGYASNHGDPRHWMKMYNDSMDKFRARVAVRLATQPQPVEPGEIMSERKIKVILTRAENASFFNVPIGSTVEVDFEKYINAVVASEIGNSHVEACKAQAIMARTYALSRVGSGGAISDDSSVAQAYRAPRGENPAYGNCIIATLATAGQVLFYNGKLVETAVYSDANGGHVMSSQERWGGIRPYLVSKPDPWDFALSKGVKNGHGVGMSQTGARYAASIGIEHKEILAFYMPGTILVPKYGEGIPEEINLAEPEGEEMISMTGKYAKVNTVKDAGLNLWSNTKKNLSLATVPKGGIVFVIQDNFTGWVFAKKDDTQGYVDKQYLLLLPEEEQAEQELEEPVIEEPTINFPQYEAVINTKYDEGLSLWNNTRKNVRLIGVKKGETITVIDEINSQWAIAIYQGIRGYVDRRYLKNKEEQITYTKNGLELNVIFKKEDQLNIVVNTINDLNR